MATDFDLDVAGTRRIGRLQCDRNQDRRAGAWGSTTAVDNGICRDIDSLLIAMRFDPTAQEIGIELVRQRHRGNRDAGLQTGRNHSRLEFWRVFPQAARCRRSKYGCVHVSTKNIVDTIVAAWHYVSNVARLDAYELTHLIECKLADSSVHRALAGFAARFADAEAVHLIRNLRQDEVRGRVQLTDAARWLAALDA